MLSGVGGDMVATRSSTEGIRAQLVRHRTGSEQIPLVPASGGLLRCYWSPRVNEVWRRRRCGNGRGEQ